MAILVTKPMSEAEAYVAEGAREISERLQQLLRQHRRRRGAEIARVAADHPVVAAAAFLAGALLAVLLADRLIAGQR
jgi:hypothetical protein